MMSQAFKTARGISRAVLLCEIVNANEYKVVQGNQTLRLTVHDHRESFDGVLR